VNRVLGWLNDLEDMGIRATLEELDKMISWEIKRGAEEALSGIMISFQDLYTKVGIVAASKSEDVQSTVGFCKKKTFETLKESIRAYRRETS